MTSSRQSEGDVNDSPRRANGSATISTTRRARCSRGQRSVPAPVGVDAVPVGDPPRRRHLDRGHGRPALHGFPRQQRAPHRLWPSATHRSDQGQMDELPFAPRRFASSPRSSSPRSSRAIAPPAPLGKVLFTTGGSDAIEVALKLARAATGRFKTLSLLGLVSRRGLRRRQRRRRGVVPLGRRSARCCRAPSTSRRSAAIAAPTATARRRRQPPLDAMPARLRQRWCATCSSAKATSRR